jgi:para-aminobenzoate synthetase component 1
VHRFRFAGRSGSDPVETLVWRLGDPGDPFALLERLAARGGLCVGWLGYDLGRVIERLPSPPPDDVGLPDLFFARYERWGDGGPPLAASGPPPRLGPLAADEPPERHLAAIERALEYIRAGDIYQVNLARRLSAAVLAPGDALALHDRLPGAPWSGYLEHGDLAVVSDSPELFLRRDGDRVETRPIKGTRARAADPAELARDPKELAEHLMIVDLERNDLGRVARIGTVSVDDYARVVTLPTVHHLESTVSARLRPGVGVAELLRATFPGGSITGAPKVRAMQIIDELEPVRRGVYTGALGCIGPGDTMELSIVIRTAVIGRGALRLHVGGGIVADSIPARELVETEEKAASWRSGLEVR